MEQKNVDICGPKKNVSRKTTKNTHFRPFWVHNSALLLDNAMKIGRVVSGGVLHLPRKHSKKNFPIGTQKWPILKKKVVPLVLLISKSTFFSKNVSEIDQVFH